MTALRIALPDLISPSYFPAIAAIELGLLKEQGFEATLALCFPVTEAYAKLREGGYDFVVGAAHAVFHAFENGEGCKLIGAISHGMYWFLVVRADISSEESTVDVVRGLKIAAAPGPVDGLRRILRDAGIDPDEDVEIVTPPPDRSGGVSFGVAAAESLESGEVDGFWANGMGAEVAARRGVGRVVIDARRERGSGGTARHTFPALVTTDLVIRTNPRAVQAVVSAVKMAHDLLKQAPEQASDAARRQFPPYERGLIADLVRRDLPFYDVSISHEMISSLVDFARGEGILSAADGVYASLVEDQFFRRATMASSGP